MGGTASDSERGRKGGGATTEANLNMQMSTILHKNKVIAMIYNPVVDMLPSPFAAFLFRALSVSIC